MLKAGKRKNTYKFWIHVFFVLFCLGFIVPFLFVISISLTSEESIRQIGYRLIPDEISLTAYRYVFANPKQITSAYKVTIIQALTATFLAVLVMSLCAYPLSRQNFKFRKPITFFVFFTMLFGGGLVPSYILITQYLKMGNTIWVYILPNIANAFHIIIFRTFFQGLPESLPESAKIDGASELRILFQIILPLSKPVLATIALFVVLSRWNDWFTALIYIRDSDLYSLQFLLQRILMQAEFIRAMAVEIPIINDMELFETPTESMRFALAIVAAGPMLVIFPFFQKYFTRGITIGAVKG